MKNSKMVNHYLELKEGLVIKTIMNNSEDTIYFKNLESKFILNSKAHAAQFNESDVKQLIGKSDFDYFPNEFSQTAFENEQEIIKTGRAQVGVVEKWNKPNGEVIWFSASKYPLYDEEDNIIGTWGTSRNITALKEAEEQLSIMNQQLIEANTRLETLATRDGLSGLYNHRHFFDSLNVARAQYLRSNEKGTEVGFSILILDIDRFKLINDSYGHHVGDYVIKTISELFTQSTRLSDMIFRIGGDEFAILLMNTSLKSAQLLAEKIRRKVEEEIIKIDNVELKLTTSIGVASSLEVELIVDLVTLCDSRLYHSKENGRNRVS